MLPRPPYITAANDTQDQHFAADSELPVSDTSTETESDADFIPFQDHTTYITGPSTRNQPESNTEEPYTSTHIPVGSIELHEQSITILEDEITSTPTRTCPIPLPRPSKATNVKQTNANQQRKPTQAHPYPAPVRKSPLLPTPPASERQFNNMSNYKQHISRPSTFNNSRKPAFSGPSPINNHRFHQQPYIPRPHTPRFNNQRPPLLPSPSCQHQNFITRPYQQPQGHCTQQVYPQPYVPIVILTPYSQLNNVLAHQTNLFNPNQY